MLRQFGITYKTAGENIAGNGSVSGAHTSLMNSPSHKANILNTGFTHVGIGIVGWRSLREDVHPAVRGPVSKETLSR